MQAQATHYLTKLVERSETFLELCKRLSFENVEELKRLCKYSGEIECENRVRELVNLQESTDLSDLLKHAIFEPETFDDFKTLILRQQEE